MYTLLRYTLISDDNYIISMLMIMIIITITIITTIIIIIIIIITSNLCYIIAQLNYNIIINSNNDDNDNNANNITLVEYIILHVQFVLSKTDCIINGWLLRC